MKFEIPKPPSINTIYRYTSRGGYAKSYISKEGMEWFAAAGEIIAKSQIRRKQPIEKDVEVWISLYTARMQDIDNILKPTLDLLANYCLKCQSKYSSRKACSCRLNLSLLKDDRQIYKLDVEKWKVKHKTEERIIVEIMGY